MNKLESIRGEEKGEKTSFYHKSITKKIIKRTKREEGKLCTEEEKKRKEKGDREQGYEASKKNVFSCQGNNKAKANFKRKVKGSKQKGLP